MKWGTASSSSLLVSTGGVLFAFGPGSLLCHRILVYSWSHHLSVLTFLTSNDVTMMTLHTIFRVPCSLPERFSEQKMSPVASQQPSPLQTLDQHPQQLNLPLNF